MMCWGRKLKRDQATQTDISYVHCMRLVEYDTRKPNEDTRVVQRDSIPPGLCADVIETVEKKRSVFR